MGKLKLKCSHLPVKVVLLWPCTTLMRYTNTTLSSNYSQTCSFGDWPLRSNYIFMFPFKYSPSVLSLRHRWTLLMRKSGHFISAQRTPFLRNTMAGMWTVSFRYFFTIYTFCSTHIDIWCWLHFVLYYEDSKTSSRKSMKPAGSQSMRLLEYGESTLSYFFPSLSCVCWLWSRRI